MMNDRQRSYWLHRTLCDVLREMRNYIKQLESYYTTGNSTKERFELLYVLIEEAQSMANRMESALGEKKDLAAMNEEWHRLRREIKELRREAKELGKQLGREDEETDRDELDQLLEEF